MVMMMRDPKWIKRLNAVKEYMLSPPSIGSGMGLLIVYFKNILLFSGNAEKRDLRGLLTFLSNWLCFVML